MSEDRVEIRFREFRPADVDPLYFIARRNSPQEITLAYGRLVSLLMEPDVAAMVAEAHVGDWSRVVGGLVVRGEAWNARMHIVLLLVDRGFQRQGLGRRLATWAERLARSARCTEVVLPLPAGHADATPFLQRLGFTPQEEAGPFFASPEEGTLWRLSLPAEEESP